MINPKAFFGGMVFGGIKHVYLLATSMEYRKLAIYNTLYSSKRRFTKARIKCCGRILNVPDVASFLSMYEEIFLNRIYEVKAEQPRILDLGANIGLSVIWFKENFPKSEILAIEADPNIYQYLMDNTSGLDGVSIKNIAAWDEDGELSFYSEGADGGRIEQAAELSPTKTVKVASVDIRRILKENGPFDFIKMDIEGAEARVLPACRGYLQETRYVFCEYHSTESEKQHFAELVSFLKDEGFRLHIQSVNTSGQPFMTRRINAGFDMQLNIFGWRE